MIPHFANCIRSKATDSSSLVGQYEWWSTAFRENGEESCSMLYTGYSEARDSMSLQDEYHSSHSMRAESS